MIKIRRLLFLIKRTLQYGVRFLYDLEYREIVRKKRLRKKEKEKKIKKFGRKRYNRIQNYRYNVKKRILKGNAYGMCNGCWFWKPKEELTVDHIIPISKGGLEEKKNMQLLCTECHLIKTYKDTGTKPNLLKQNQRLVKT